ncbi:MAG TPA: hypothetical protein VMN39_08605, partial [Longimicrobiaceae bacterium]|nr:hypothetical protein [Longimicrobiaceae bacterium]
FPLVQQYRSGGPYGGDFPMLYEIEQVGGEHPNPLRRWVEYIGAGTETYIDWHNLIIDPQVVNTAEGQAVAFGSRSGFLDAANIRYIISMVALEDPALREVHRGSALVYENVNSLPRAYLAPAVAEVPEGGAIAAMTSTEWDPRELAFVSSASGLELPATPLDGDAQVIEHTPDRVVVRASANRPALLVLADNFYAGWHATVNGQAAAVLPTNHTMRGVLVPAGASEVVFEFEPRNLYLGFYIYLAGLLVLSGFGAWAVLNRLRARRETAGPDVS